jgi:hypothetical protein
MRQGSNPRSPFRESESIEKEERGGEKQKTSEGK